MDLQEFLKTHVTESNAIENIYVGKNHHLFIDHMSAANYTVKESRAGKIAAPEKIHNILMARELPFPGEIRKVFVRVGPYVKPSPISVPSLMSRWRTELQKDIENIKKISNQGFSTPIAKKEELVWHYHHWFEAIHPFIDGNGRTGRLILNNIRLLLGLTWIIIFFSQRNEYYNSIKEWETKHEGLLI